MGKTTNVLTNLVPEIKNNYLWLRLEEYLRSKVPDVYETIYIISGTLFNKSSEQSNRADASQKSDEILEQSKTIDKSSELEPMDTSEQSKTEDTSQKSVDDKPNQSKETSDLVCTKVGIV